jgi:RNA recognition motif-containing protein
MVKLFVGGFPLEITELELAKLIAPFGDIATMKIVRDKQTRKCKGYAFVEMLTTEGANEAILNLDGVEMDGRALTVNISEEVPQAPNTKFRKPTTSPTKGFHKEPATNIKSRPKRPRRTLS